MCDGGWQRCRHLFAVCVKSNNVKKYDFHANYVYLFYTRYANLHCVTLVGWAKGFDYKPGSAITESPPNHSWNAVFIDGSWQLVDCHWATRYVPTGTRYTDSIVYELVTSAKEVMFLPVSVCLSVCESLNRIAQTLLIKP